jgi:hypothetical protein
MIFCYIVFQGELFSRYLILIFSKAVYISNTFSTGKLHMFKGTVSRDFPQINTLKYFRFLFRIRRDIRP